MTFRLERGSNPTWSGGVYVADSYTDLHFNSIVSLQVLRTFPTDSGHTTLSDYLKTSSAYTDNSPKLQLTGIFT